MRSPVRILEQLRPWQRVGVCLGLTLSVGALDYWSAAEGVLALLYLLPVALGAWVVGWPFALSVAGVTAGTSYVVDWPHGHFLDNAGRFGVSAVVALLASRTRKHQASEHAAWQLFASVIDAIPARVFWKDKSLAYLGCNAAFARDAGLADPKDIVGKDDHQMPWRDQAEAYRADDRTVIETGRAKLLIEEPQTTPEGNSISLLTSKLPLRGPRGEVTGVLGTYFDVTERKRAETALRASEIRYRRLFESAKDGILILDAQTGMVVDVNPFLVGLLGVSREAFLDKKVWELGFFRDLLANRAKFVELQQKEYVRFEDLALKASDGRRVEVEFVSNVYLVNHEKVIQCNIRDVTARKREQQSHARLSTAVDQSAEAIVITEADGTIVYTNPAFERTTGYTCEEVLGQNPRILKSDKQDADFYREMWTVLSRGEVWRGRITNRRKDGTLFDEDATISAVRDAAGKVVNYVAVKHDVSREALLERQLLQAQKMEAIGRLAGGVAHDFNNLLGVITGYGEIVHGRLLDEDPLKGKVEQILKAGERAAGLTRQLLAFGRQQVLQPRILDLNAVVAAMEKMLPRVIGENVDLVTVLEPRLGSVKADPGQIDQILMNLAVNARDAMPDGGRITIETCNADLADDYVATHAPARAGRYVLLSVTDTGSGMDAATQSRIFEPFFTTKAVGEGTGLGLSTVYGIVKQSDGYIWVYSEVGVGTTFKVYLPRVDEEVGPAAEEDSGALALGTETVLLVEDEASLREMLREVLDANGYSVLVARDGAEALQVAEAHAGPIELMVIDVIMPGMTGPKAVDLVAPTRPEMRVLFVSGYSAESVTRHGLMGPGRAFLAKPFGSGAFLRKVRESLDAG
jgi:two-component system cell cycle sensor histidine kinase/response regulator CckA